MFLSEITTSDQLMLALARLRYRKFGLDDDCTTEDVIATGVYSFSEMTCPCCSTKHRQLVVMPPDSENPGDVGIGAALGDDGEITGWCFWEAYVGNAVQMDPKVVELERIGPASDAWFDQFLGDQESN